MRSCEEYEELISEFLDGELSKDDQAELMKHMAACRVCQQYFNDLVAVHEAMEETAEVPVPEGLADQIMAKVRETKQETPAKVVKFPYWKRWAALAACCAVAVGLWAFQSMSRKDGQASLQAAMTASMPYTEGKTADAPASSNDDGIALPEEDVNEPAASVMDRSMGEEPAGGAADQAANHQPDQPQAEKEDGKYTRDSASGLTAPAAPPSEAPAPAPTLTAPAPVEPVAPDQTSGSGNTLAAGDAKNIALAHASLTEDGVTFTKTELGWEDGQQVYEIEFYAPAAGYDSAQRTSYDYEINAVTGAIIKYDYDAKSLSAPVPVDSSAVMLTREAAQESALAQVPGASVDNITELKLDRDDGRDLYEVEIVYNGTKYEMELDAYTGAVLDLEAEAVRR